jgi:formamidopyrimidine-DNA glycosylase
MPELPDLAAYLDALESRVVGRRLVALRIANPFLLRTAVPPISSIDGKRMLGLRRIGNAYSDEILHRAKLSPLAFTKDLPEADARRLFEAIRAVVKEWTERLRAKAGGGFPEKVTAFHEEMAVHGRYGKPCPVCGSPVQRIVYAENETNYCARCQTGGKILADRALSRLLKKSWPRNIDELE